MSTFLAPQPMNHGLHFRAQALRGEGAALTPFLGVDHAYMSAPTFPPHRHAGMAAVSYVFEDAETGLENRDSLGNANLIAPGGLHWFSAGSGAVHAEDPAASGRSVHSLQIFVALPKPLRDAAPSTLSLDPQDMPRLQRPGADIRVVLGEHDGAQSPITPPTAVTLLDIGLEPGASLTLAILAGHNAFLLPVLGAVNVDGQAIDAAQPLVPLYPPRAAAQTLSVTAGDAPARVVYFAGDPAVVA